MGEVLLYSVSLYSVLLRLVLLHCDLHNSCFVKFTFPELWFSSFLSCDLHNSWFVISAISSFDELSFSDSCMIKFFTYKIFGFPSPSLFFSTSPMPFLSSNSWSIFVAFCVAQHMISAISSIVKIIYTLFSSSSQPFFIDKFIRSSKIP